MTRRRLAVALLILLLGAAVVTCIAGSVLSAPARAEIGAPPASLQARSVLLKTALGDQVSGWFSAGKPGAGAVLLMHGVRGNRLQMLPRAEYLHARGFAVLLIDLPAHGESMGEHITYGVREGSGAQAALDYLRQQTPGEKIAVIGVSLGAASLVLAHPKPAPSAVVLESMYPTIEDAVADRLALHLHGDWARPIAPLLLTQLPLRLGISAGDLRPIDHIAQVRAPLLLIAGDQDQHTRLEETERLFAAADEPKELWIVKGAAHVDLHAFDPASYETRVGAFLKRHLTLKPD